MAKVNRDRPLIPGFGIALNDVDRTQDVMASTLSVAVDDDLDLPGMFAIDLITQEGQPDVIAWADDEEFVPGASIEVSFGYQDELAPVIVGEITSLEPVFRVDGPPGLLVRGYDLRHRLNRQRQTRTFLSQKDSEIATQICQEAHVPVDATDSGVTHDFMMQADQTDLEFLLARARNIQYELAMDGEKLLFRPVANATKVVLTLTFEDDLLEFQPRLSLLPLTEVQVLAWDAKQKDHFVSIAVQGDENGKMGGRRTGPENTFSVFNESIVEVMPAVVASQAEADRLAQGRFNAAALDYIKGFGRCRGRNDLTAGSVIEIAGIGTRFSGDYYVTSVLHSYTRRDGYVTRFEVRRNAS